MTYFHMGRPHTIIGAGAFHYRVREGIGWYHAAMAARRKGLRCSEWCWCCGCSGGVLCACASRALRHAPVLQSAWVLYGQAARSISTG